MTAPVHILGVESSCDETAAAVVADGRHVLSASVASQIDLHARFGGIVPEIASRAHIEAVNTVLQQALDAGGIPPEDLDAIAVTNEPGLIGSLLVGVMAAKTLAWAWDKPLIGVNHVYAHAYAASLDADAIEYPAVALICSGGHTALYDCRAPIEMRLLGSTIDDAAGEAFDKVAQILGLGFPGGPAIDRAAREGNPKAVDFPRTLLKGQSLDFSFSGLKTAVLYCVNGVPGADRRGDGDASTDAAVEAGTAGPDENRRTRRGRRRARRRPDMPVGLENYSPAQIADVAASFQAAVVDVLRIKLRRAIHRTGARTLVLGGGVAANSALRAAAAELAGKLDCTLRLPPMTFCVDNAAMIAGLGYHLYRAGHRDSLTLTARATVRR